MQRSTVDSVELTSSPRRWKRLGGRFIAALVAVFLLAAPYVANLFEEPTRFFYMWRREDAVLVVAGIVLAALGCVAAGEIVRGLGRSWLTAVFNHLFVIAVAAGLFANLCFYTRRDEGWHIGQFSMEMQTLWLLLIGLVGYSLARRQSRLVLRCRQLCTVLLPGVMIVFVQLLRLPAYPPRMDALMAPPSPASLAGTAGTRSAFPIYLFVFDEWSYPRTFEAGRPRENLTHLSSLCAQATVYHDAHSPGEETVRSMPGLLLQTPEPMAWRDGRVGFERDGQWLAPESFPTIFDAAGDAARFRVLIEWGPPSHLWLGGRVDAVRSYLWYPLGRGPISRLAAHWFESTYYWTDPWFTWLYARLKTRVKDHQLLSIHQAIRQDALEMIRGPSAEAFAIVHLPLPHHPYLMDANGEYRGPDGGAWEKANLEGYQRNLARLDHLLGEFVAAMKAAGRYDDAMIVLTSDHSWRDDPARGPSNPADALTHVPLIVKRPGQTSPVCVEERFETWRLGDLIREARAETRFIRSPSEFTSGNQVQTGPVLHDTHGKSAYVQ